MFTDYAAGATAPLFDDAADIRAILQRTPWPLENVQGHGAVGDGVHDDSTAFQAAVAQVPSAGGAVYVPPGTYWVPNLPTITRSHLALLVAGATIRTTGTLKLVGDHNVVDLGGGTLDGALAYTAVAVQAPIGATSITVADGTVFRVGDQIQSSYGLGGDGSNPITITAITGNVLTVATPTFGILPIGARVGTWLFNALVSVEGDNNVLRNGLLRRVRGIAVDVRSGSEGVLVEGIRVSETGLQHLQVVNAIGVVVRRSSFGPILDAAKQSVGVSGARAELVMADCVFAPQNYDAVVVLGGAASPATDEAEVVLDRCRIDALGGAVPAPYNLNGAVVYQAGGMARRLTIRDSVVSNYRFGVATDVNTAVGATAKRVVLAGCDFSVGNAPWSFYAATHAPTEVLVARDCRFNSTVADFWSTGGTFEGCTFDRCAFDAASSFSGRMTDCTFLTCTGVRFTAAAYLDGCSFSSTTIGTFPLSGADKLLGELHLGECLFTHADFPSGTLSNVVTAQADHAMNGHLREATSTLPVVFYVNHAGTTLYLVDCDTFYQVYPTQLRNADWKIPVNSRFRQMNTTPSRYYVNKSNSTTLNGAVAAAAGTITVASATGMASGDVLNVLCDDGRVHTTTINGAPAGAVLTLTDAMPFAAASGKGVCAYTYTIDLDDAAWTAYTPTWTGFSAAPTGGLRYKQVGKTVFVRSAITGSGTSNATGLTFTLPVAAQSTQVGQSYGLGIDNGVTVTTPCRIDLSSTTVATAYTTPAAAGWTAAGAKAIHFSFTYEAG
jgi:uncharacterized protein YjbI with pentapeptide repeats